MEMDTVNAGAESPGKPARKRRRKRKSSQTKAEDASQQQAQLEEVESSCANDFQRKQESEICMVLHGGSNFTKHAPVFSLDGKYLMCCSGHLVRVLSVATGDTVQNLVWHTSEVTSVFMDPHNRLEVYTASMDSYIAHWDFMEGDVLKVYSCGHPILGCLASTTLFDFITLVWRPGYTTPEVFGMSKETPTKTMCGKIAMSGETEASGKQRILKERRIFRHASANNKCLSLGCNGTLLACSAQRSLLVYSLTEKKTYQCSFADSEFGEATCVTVHPKHYSVATAHEGCSGKIILWYDVSISPQPKKSICHWHSLTAKHIAFTPEGSYMLTGGHECVLVKWHLPDMEKSFLPRMGAPISRISCSADGQLYVTLHTDNTARVLSATMQVKQLLQGLSKSQTVASSGSRSAGKQNPEAQKTPKGRRQSKPHSRPYAVGLQLDPRTGAIVTNGRAGHLQFYSLAEDKLLFSLDVVGENYISPENLSRPLASTEITHTRLSPDGCWLFTAEEWTDQPYTPERSLKFWAFSREKQTYKLNTSVQLAEDETTTSLACTCSSGQLILASTHENGLFKLWTLEEGDSDLEAAKINWACQVVNSYRKLQPLCSQFSADDSMLAIGFEHVLTLWDPFQDEYTCSLLVPGSKALVRQIEFGEDLVSHRLFTRYDDIFCVWDMQTNTVVWSLAESCSCMLFNPQSHSVVLFTQNSQKKSGPEMVVISGAELSELERHAVPCSVVAGILLPICADSGLCQSVNTSATETEPVAGPSQSSVVADWLKGIHLYFMTLEQELYSVKRRSDLEAQSTTTALMSVQNMVETPLSVLLARSTLGERDEITETGVTPATSRPPTAREEKESKQAIDQLLSAPSYVMPAVSEACRRIFELSLHPKRKESDATGDSMEAEYVSSQEIQYESISIGNTSADTLHALPLVDSAPSSEQDRKQLESLRTEDFDWFGIAFKS